MITDILAQDVLKFWFEEVPEKNHWLKDPDFDKFIAARFSNALDQAIAGELAFWRESAEGRLAEIIVLDQFSRNIYRNTSHSFSQDPQALSLAQEAVRSGAFEALDASKKSFLIMPIMHSESLKVHQDNYYLFEYPGLEKTLNFEDKHLNIIKRFGRYPHRNHILGRSSTPEEIDFLTQPDSSF